MNTLTHPAFEYDDDGSWSELSLWLEPQVRCWAYASNLLYWKGEEEATIEEIVAETVIRILEYNQKVNAQKAKPIVSLYSFARQIAYHCFIDQVRKDRRKIRLSQITDGSEKSVIEDTLPSIEESTDERLFREQLFNIVAYEVSHFPKKQREAFLKDQARLIDRMRDPLPLLRAYQNAGIRLQDYRNCVPANQAESSRHTSLLYHAYQRIAHLPSVRKYIS